MIWRIYGKCLCCSRIGLSTDFHAVGEFGQKIQRWFGHFSGRNWTWERIFTMSISSPNHLCKSSPQHEIHYPNKYSYEMAQIIWLPMKKIKKRWFPGFLLLILIMSKCSPAMSKSTHTWGRIWAIFFISSHVILLQIMWKTHMAIHRHSERNIAGNVQIRLGRPYKPELRATTRDAATHSCHFLSSNHL